MIIYRFRHCDLDPETGALTSESLREFARSVWDAPIDEVVYVDLGPIRQLQMILVRDTSLMVAAVRFVGPDWRAVRAHREALERALGVAA